MEVQTPQLRKILARTYWNLKKGRKHEGNAANR